MTAEIRYAALIELAVGDVDREAGLAGLRNHLVPAISAMPGFQSGVWLTGNESDVALSLTVWTSAQAAEAMLERFAPGTSPQSGASVVRSELREVAATAQA